MASATVDALGLVSRRVEGDLDRFKTFVEGQGRKAGAWRGTEHGVEAGAVKIPVMEELEAQHAKDVRGFETYEPELRSHYHTAFANRGHPYEYWAPAYRYGYELAQNPRYHGRDWPELEAEARSDWTKQHTGVWEEFKDTVRYAWDKVRGKR